MSVKMVLTRPIDQSVGLKIEAEKWGSSGWTKVPYLPIIPDACNTMKRFYSQYMIDFWRTVGVKNPDKCPIPPGDYILKNYTFASNPQTEQTAVPVHGRVRLTVSLVDMTTKIPFLCTNVYMQS
ncbi:unnamed protein product [Acanthoscelides obtectus]|nr:unnamed protein product [Acanthoscelides obtectus]CAK1665116.1 hypothetical protein AOBTE_LOCUS24663 [Acanthoscelides obtectus]